jgi:hypothetical protein
MAIKSKEERKKMKVMTDLGKLETTAREFIKRGRAGGKNPVVDVHYDSSTAIAKVLYQKSGPDDIVEKARLEAPELQEISGLIRERFGTGGDFQLECAYTWSIKYGPCYFYGGSAEHLRDLFRGEIEKITRLPRDWKPMSPEEIRQAMTDDY